MAVMPIPNDWDGETWQCCVIQWPASQQWWAIFLGFVTTPSYGRFWDERTGSILEAQAVGQQIEQANNCLWEIQTMGCLEDVITAINNLTGVIQGGQSNVNCGGCNGSGGAGFSSEEPTTFVDDGANYPDGYADRASYLSSKCNLAAYVIDLLIGDLRKIRVANVSSFTLQAAVAMLTTTLFTPVPFDEIFGIAALILALVSAAIDAYTDTIDEFIDALQNDFDLCILYEASDVETAKDSFDNWVDGRSFTYDTLATPFLKALVGYNSLNKLFGPKPEDINVDELPVADCSGCQQDPCAMVEGSFTYTGNLQAVDEQPGYIEFTIDSVVSGSYHYVGFGIDDQSCCNDYEIISMNGYVVPSNGNRGFYYDCDTIELHDNVQDVADFNGCHWRIGIRGNAANAWTLVIRVQVCTE